MKRTFVNFRKFSTEFPILFRKDGFNPFANDSISEPLTPGVKISKIGKEGFVSGSKNCLGAQKTPMFGNRKDTTKNCVTKILPNVRVNFLVRLGSKPLFYWVMTR